MISYDKDQLMAIFREFNSIKKNRYTNELVLRSVALACQLEISENNPLTKQETLCLILQVLGFKKNTCATLMKISVNSVKTYTCRVKEKLGATNVANAYYLATIHKYLYLIH